MFFGKDAAVAELVDGRGNRYDEEVVNMCLSLVDSGFGGKGGKDVSKKTGEVFTDAGALLRTRPDDAPATASPGV